MKSGISKTSSGRGKTIFGGVQVIAVVLLCFGLAYLLIPQETELVERLVEDGHHDRARELIVTTNESGNGDGDALSLDDQQSQAANLIEVLLMNHRGDPALTPEDAQRITTLVKLTTDADKVHSLLEENRTLFSDSDWAHCISALAKRCIELADPARAADLYEELWAVETPDTDRLAEMVTACRYAGRPQQALDAISRHMNEEGVPFSRLPEDLRMAAVSLHREINEGSAAFDLLSDEYLHTTDPVSRQHIMDLMTVTAAQSERIEDCLPMVEDYVASLDTDSKDWSDLLRKDDSRADDESFLKYAKILAQHREWNGKIAESFETYRKLAALGDISSLDRCVTIYPWIDRQDDTAELLSQLVPVADRPQYSLLSARFEADRGHLDHAIDLMESLLADGKDANWTEFAHLLDEAGRFDDAIAAYQRAAHETPEKTTPLKFAARLLLARGRNQQALDALQRMNIKDHDEHSLENYLMLASALGDEENEELALQMRIQMHSKRPRASDFQDLSEVWKQRGAMDKAIAVARDGVASLPDSHDMTLTLIDHLIDARQFDEAKILLGRKLSTGDSRIQGRLLQIAGELEEPTAVLAMLNSGDISWPPSLRLELATLLEMGGQVSTAMSIYRQTPGGEAAIHRLEAEADYARGEYLSAIAHQKLYLENIPTPDYEGWMFLGDLHGASGNSSAARAAYQYALSILKGSIQPSSTETGSDEDSIAAGLAATLGR